jgi:TonB family protein
VIRAWLFLVGIIFFAFAYAADEQPLVAHIIDSSTKRIPTHTVAPEYPRKARRDRIEGEVQVCFDVDRDGRTRRIAVRHSTHRAFEKPSIKAVRASTFRSIGREDPLQIMKSCRTFIFSLEPAEEEDDTINTIAGSESAQNFPTKSC